MINQQSVIFRKDLKHSVVSYTDNKINSVHCMSVLIQYIQHCNHFRHYELKRNDDIVCFFNDFSDHLAEEALWELSLKIKPRNITRRRTEREEKT